MFLRKPLAWWLAVSVLALWVYVALAKVEPPVMCGPNGSTTLSAR